MTRWLLAMVFGLVACSRSGYQAPKDADTPDITADAIVDTTDAADASVDRSHLHHDLPTATDLQLDVPLDTSSSSDATVSKIILVSEDTSVKQGSPDKAFGAEPELGLGYCGGPSNANMRIWLKFDLSGVNAPIVSARVALYFFIHWHTQSYIAHLCADDSWTEQTLTWNNQHQFEPDIVDTVAPFEQDAVWKHWDVTAIASQEQAGDGTLTVVIEGEAFGDPLSGSNDMENWAYSKEHTISGPSPRLLLELAN